MDIAKEIKNIKKSQEKYGKVVKELLSDKELKDIVKNEKKIYEKMMKDTDMEGVMLKLNLYIKKPKSDKMEVGIVPFTDGYMGEVMNSGDNMLKCKLLFDMGRQIAQKVDGTLVATLMTSEAWSTKIDTTKKDSEKEYDKLMKKYGSIGKMPDKYKQEVIIISAHTLDNRSIGTMIKVNRDKDNNMVKDTTDKETNGVMTELKSSLLEAFKDGFSVGQMEGKNG